MGNEPEEKKPENLKFVKSLTLNYERKFTKNEIIEKDKKEFNKFKSYMMSFEYYKKILKLGCRKNPVLKLLYQPEGSFNGYNQQMFYLLENIPYVNYQECLNLIEVRHSHTLYNVNPKKENSPTNINAINIDFININDNNNKSKKEVNLVKKSSFKTSEFGFRFRYRFRHGFRHGFGYRFRFRYGFRFWFRHGFRFGYRCRLRYRCGFCRRFRRRFRH